MEHGFVPHRVEHAFQELEELTAPLRHDLKLDEICHWHRSAPWIEIGVSPVCNALEARSDPCPRGSKSDSEGLMRLFVGRHKCPLTWATHKKAPACALERRHVLPAAAERILSGATERRQRIAITG